MMDEFPLGPCPEWCSYHVGNPMIPQSVAEYRTHHSAPRQLLAEDEVQCMVEIVRYDETSASEFSSVGMTDFTMLLVKGDEPVAEWYMTANQIREYVRQLTELVSLADPHSTNGQPLEWFAGAGSVDGD
ncbi:MAG: hypothetical protein ACRDQH_07980 [Pseudonocardiaceae bacterium]